MAGIRDDFQYPIRAETRHYTPTLHSTTDDEIEKAIEIMKTNSGSHKGRILACERELRKRKRGIKQ